MDNKTPHIRSIQIPVGNLDNAIDYYCEKLNFSVLAKDASTVSLSLDNENELLKLVSDASARQLGHFALLLPSRSSMGCFLHHLIKKQIPILGAIDHRFCESIYLSDPDTNNIEIACDKTGQTWFDEANILRTGDGEFDYEGIYYSCNDSKKEYLLPEITRIGHIMLNVHDLRRQKHFYESAIGLHETYLDALGRVYLSYGDYHHLIGLNPKSASEQAPPNMRPITFTIGFPDCTSLKEVLNKVSANGVTYEETNSGYLVIDPEGNRINLVLEA
ncbi:MAG: VOC family protein [Bacilli bacterium]|nr:VOC family protein [Bacilli bacterium]